MRDIQILLWTTVGGALFFSYLGAPIGEGRVNRDERVRRAQELWATTRKERVERGINGVMMAQAGRTLYWRRFLVLAGVLAGVAILSLIVDAVG